MSVTHDRALPTEHLANRFHLLTLAFQRAKQLSAGAKPRVPAGGHKPTRVALMELAADTISWSTEPEDDAALLPPPEPVFGTES
jgi:DNA-directed RNA polymerase omega subunit